jgi:4,5-dihydroxyphthalate decarboxylase
MISLSCAISEYEHVRDLQLGLVVPVGFSLNFVNLPVEEIFYRAIRFKEFDISEMSMGRYVAMVSSNDCPFVAIPVFPSRSFRHSAIYVRSDSGIDSPQGLRGRRVGIPEWAQTAGIYVRGLLSDQYGVAAKDIEWIQGGLQQAGREEEVALKLPPDIRLRSEKERTLNEMFLAGDLDAIISAHPPDAVKQKDVRVRYLFDMHGDAELSYWKSIRIFPIMHAIVIRKEVFERNRWIATNLQRAFEDSKNRSLARAKEMTASRFPLPLMRNYMQTTTEAFGEDLWPYGIEANRKTLDAFLRYAHEQSVSQRLLKTSDIFPVETSSQYKI